eukprot:2279519-Pleurochrysis_carterae.AAC.1
MRSSQQSVLELADVNVCTQEDSLYEGFTIRLNASHSCWSDGIVGRPIAFQIVSDCHLLLVRELYPVTCNPSHRTRIASLAHSRRLAQKLTGLRSFLISFCLTSSAPCMLARVECTLLPTCAAALFW